MKTFKIRTLIENDKINYGLFFDSFNQVGIPVELPRGRYPESSHLLTPSCDHIVGEVVSMKVVDEGIAVTVELTNTGVQKMTAAKVMVSQPLVPVCTYFNGVLTPMYLVYKD